MSAVRTSVRGQTDIEPPLDPDLDGFKIGLHRTIDRPIDRLATPVLRRSTAGDALRMRRCLEEEEED